MILRTILACLLILFTSYSYSQDSLAIDSVKSNLNSRYDALAKAMDSRDLDKMLVLKTTILIQGKEQHRVTDYLEVLWIDKMRIVIASDTKETLFYFFPLLNS